MGLMDIAKAIGMVHVVKRNKNTGEITFDKTFKNQLTNYAVSQSAALWAGQQVVTPSMISVGTGAPSGGQTSTTPQDTALWSELPGTRKQIDYATVWLINYTQYSATYDQTMALGTVDPVNNPNGSIAITEAGLWDANGNLWSHVALNVTHDNQSTLSIQWQILHQGN
jgi:hypothetical protein